MRFSPHKAHANAAQIIANFAQWLNVCPCCAQEVPDSAFHFEQSGGRDQIASQQSVNGDSFPFSVGRDSEPSELFLFFWTFPKQETSSYRLHAVC